MNKVTVETQTGLQTVAPIANFVPGASDFAWLKEQALDQVTLDIINLIEEDERKFYECGVSTASQTNLVLNLKQGVIHTTRRTSHSVANLFVQIYKLGEHMQLREFAEDAKVILDIGANEGYYALSMLSHNPLAKLICVEPNPIALDLLKKNIKANNMSGRVKVIEKALWSSSGEEELCVIPQVTSIGAIEPIATSYAKKCPDRVEKIKVATVSPAKLFSSLGIDQVDILKVDIEGGEGEVFKALVPFLPKIRKIVLEYHSQELRLQITALLVSHGFKEVSHMADRHDFGDLYFEQQAL